MMCDTVKNTTQQINGVTKTVHHYQNQGSYDYQLCNNLQSPPHRSLITEKYRTNASLILAYYYYYKFVGFYLCNGTPLPSKGAFGLFIIIFFYHFLTYIFLTAYKMLLSLSEMPSHSYPTDDHQ